ncbi:MAG: cytochrome c biogenesis protein CcdA [Chloroflexi bacterium]|nr:cytochrome c biogenesis protein CcdA [Chloroflexota bacterium]
MGEVSLALAFGAGLVSFISPCVLPLVPAYVGHLAGTSVVAGRTVPRIQVLSHASLFVLGFSAAFVLIWVLMGLVGLVVQDYLFYLRRVGGIVLVLMGLHMMGIIRIPFLYREMRMGSNFSGKAGYRRSFTLGSLFAAGWTPCIGPVLGAVIGLATLNDTVVEGAYLLVAYSLGLGIPFLLSAWFLSFSRGILLRINRHYNLVSTVGGVFVIGVGILMLTNLFATIPQYFYWGVL